MASAILVLCVLGFAFVAGDDVKELTCYGCSEEHKSCQDPVNQAELAEVRCSSLSYDDDHFRKINIKRMSNTRAKLVGYSCVKLKYKNSAQNAVFTLRNCVDIRENVKDSCDLLKEEYGNSLESCDLCNEDKCNSAMSVSTSKLALGVLFGVILYFFWEN